MAMRADQRIAQHDDVFAELAHGEIGDAGRVGVEMRADLVANPQVAGGGRDQRVQGMLTNDVARRVEMFCAQRQSQLPVKPL